MGNQHVGTFLRGSAMSRRAQDQREWVVLRSVPAARLEIFDGVKPKLSRRAPRQAYLYQTTAIFGRPRVTTSSVKRRTRAILDRWRLSRGCQTSRVKHDDHESSAPNLDAWALGQFRTGLTSFDMSRTALK